MSKKPTSATSRWQSVGRKALAASMLAALTLSFSACEKEKTDVAPTATEDPTLKRLLAMGFDKKNIEDKGTYYLVEGDIRFDKQAAGTTPATQPGVTAQSQDQSHSWELIVYDKQPLITYSIDSQFSSADENIIQDAVAEWNSIQGCRIHLTRTSGFADINIIPQNLGPGNYGQGDFPHNGSPGTFLRTDPSQVSSANPGTFKLVLVHELGHVFGFRHTDWIANGENESGYSDTSNGTVVITGTPATDANSVMNSGGAPNHGPTAVWVGFSTNDIIGFQNLYPVYASSVGTNYFKILNRATGKSMDVSGGGSNGNDGVQVVQWGDGGSYSEHWYLQSAGNDHYKIRNRVTTKSLDVNGGNNSTNNDVPIVQWGDGNASSENWRLQDVGGGYYKIVNRATGKCIDVSGGGGGDGKPLVQYYYQGHASQQWRLVPL